MLLREFCPRTHENNTKRPAEQWLLFYTFLFSNFSDEQTVSLRQAWSVRHASFLVARVLHSIKLALSFTRLKESKK